MYSSNDTYCFLSNITNYKCILCYFYSFMFFKILKNNLNTISKNFLQKKMKIKTKMQYFSEKFTITG